MSLFSALQVARRTLLHNGLTEAAINEKLGDCMDSMIRYAAAHHQNAKTGIEVLPGVAELLEELSKRPEKVTVALVRFSLLACTLSLSQKALACAAT